MDCFSLGEYHRPPIFNRVAEGLAKSNLNPPAYNATVAPIRLVAGLVVAAVSPVFAACDLLIYLGAAFIGFFMYGEGEFALENLKDSGRLLVRFIPSAIIFPFAFAYNPDAYVDRRNSSAS